MSTVMRVLARGAYRGTGVGKASGKAYDMGKLIVEIPVENVSMPNMNRFGFGMTVAELDIEPECVVNFDFPYPCELELETANKMQFGRLQTVITGATLVLDRG